VKITLHSAWIKIDETLPWIELEGCCRTRIEARKMAKQTIRNIRMKIVAIPEKRKHEKTPATMKTDKKPH
jgi:hypothetical protein